MDLTIRPFTESDFAPLCALLADPEVMRRIEAPYDAGKTRRFLESAGLSEPPLIYAVEDEHGGFLGYVIDHDYESDSREIGWVLKKEVWGRGCASALTAMLIERSRAAGKAVLLECAPEQTVTKHIAARFGFSPAGQRDGLELFRLEPDALVPIVPAYADLWFRQQMLADPDTMAYNRAWGGTIPFPEEDWADWYRCWVAQPEGLRFYRYLKKGADFVGEIAWHFDAARGLHLADVIVYAPCRGRGYGTEGLRLLCRAAAESGVKVLYDDIAIDNPAIGLFLAQGFTEEYRTDEIIMLKKALP